MPMLQAFSITFFGEWGDKSQVSITAELGISAYILGVIIPFSLSLSYASMIAFQLATIGLAADENPIGVVLGGIM